MSLVSCLYNLWITWLINKLKLSYPQITQTNNKTDPMAVRNSIQKMV
jgi:hypothetical protein